MTRPSDSRILREILEDFPETFPPSPRHALDPGVAVQNMMGARVAVDFFKLHERNKFERFIAVEADTTGESSDYGDAVLYGLFWSSSYEAWLPTYMALRELDDYEYIMLPRYGNDPRHDKVADVVKFLSERGVDMYS